MRLTPQECAECFALTQSIAHVGSWRMDVRAEALTWSDETYRIFAIPPGTPLSLAVFVERVHPDDREKLIAAWNAALAGAPYDFEHRILADGKVKWVRERAEVRRDADGRPSVAYGAVQDITDIKDAEERLRVAAVAFDSRDGMVVTDARGVILKVNQAFVEVTGYSAEEAVGQTPALLRSGRHDDAFYRRMWEAIRYEGRWEGEMWNRRKDGGIYLEWLTISAIRGPSGEVEHYLGVFTPVIESFQARQKILDLTLYDPLTGLPNRRLLLDRLQQALASSARDGQFGALLMLDIDNFKTVNDTRGHEAGDQLLVATARRLGETLREADTAARLGGDEFFVLLEFLGDEELAAARSAEAIAEKLRAALSLPCDIKGGACHIGASIGIALFRGHDKEAEALFKQADLALYQAKGAGRNAIRFYNPDMQAAIDERVALETGLRHALSGNEFVLHYQPQVDAGGRLIGTEALLRWQPPGRPMVPPGAFIPLAEESDLILPIGRWALESACRQIAAWSHDQITGGLRVAVNISARQFRQADFVEQVRAALQDTGANPRSLKLELTESSVVDDVDKAIETMKAIKALGVGFSMDDFGTGHSSLSSLKRLPIGQLKIDRSFVCDVPGDPDACAIAEAIVALGRSLRLHVIAEGVETEAQRDFLESVGCGAFQGYLYGRPGPAADIETLARAAKPLH